MVDVMRYLISLLIALTITSCAPRGETKTLDQILDNARVRYQEAFDAGVQGEGDLQTQLASLSSSLEKLLSASDAAQAQEVEDTLRELILHAGFTTRPAMNELSSQYALLAEESEVAPERKKLLVSRTYRMLARELETTRFRL